MRHILTFAVLGTALAGPAMAQTTMPGSDVPATGTPYPSYQDPMPPAGNPTTLPQSGSTGAVGLPDGTWRPGTTGGSAGVAPGTVVPGVVSPSAATMPPGTVIARVGAMPDLETRMGRDQDRLALVQTTMLNTLGGLGLGGLRDVRRTGDLYYAEALMADGNWRTVAVDPASGTISVVR